MSLPLRPRLARTGLFLSGWYAFSSVDCEMDRTYVAINDPVQAVLRDCTRRSTLRVHAPGQPVLYEVRAGNLSDTYFALAAFHSIQGFSIDETNLPRWRVQEVYKAAVADAAGYFDATRVDQRCAGDLRLKPAGQGALMVAAELLCFGTGALRPVGYSPRNAYQIAEYGRLTTLLETNYAGIRALCCGPGSSAVGADKEIYCSTNIVYGDALGELEQLWERRADIEFLDQVASYLQSMRFWPKAAAPSHGPLNFEMVMKIHLRAQAVWKMPPANGRALLRRIEFVLDHLFIDNNPATVFDAPGRRVQQRPGPSASDRSGYDGWLSDTPFGCN